MLVTSRSFLEYQAFFAVTAADLAGRVLDCSAGASAFAATANSRGGRVTAVDPAYKEDVAVLAACAVASSARGAQIVADNDDHFVWTWYRSRERRDQLRRDALSAFTADRRAHPETYVAAALPDLPFGEDAFDLALCSHLLFTWADVFDEEWHLEAVRELLRVAAQVRVFPLVLQGTGDPVPFLPDVMKRLTEDGHHVDLVSVRYEFQRGATTMLILNRGGGTPPPPRRVA